MTLRKFSLRTLIFAMAFSAMAIAWYADRHRLVEEIDTMTPKIQSMTNKIAALEYGDTKLTRDRDAMQMQVRNLSVRCDVLTTEILELKHQAAYSVKQIRQYPVDKPPKFLRPVPHDKSALNGRNALPEYLRLELPGGRTKR